ncbi:MAG: hypothetical protein WC867_06510 [Candidatus Pacearchaeota archaeon]
MLKPKTMGSWERFCEFEIKSPRNDEELTKNCISIKGFLFSHTYRQAICANEEFYDISKKIFGLLYDSYTQFKVRGIETPIIIDQDLPDIKYRALIKGFTKEKVHFSYHLSSVFELSNKVPLSFQAYLPTNRYINSTKNAITRLWPFIRSIESIDDIDLEGNEDFNGAISIYENEDLICCGHESLSYLGLLLERKPIESRFITDEKI